MAGWDGKGVDPWLPERVASEIKIVKAERKLYTSWWGSLSGWLTQVHRSVLRGGRPDAEAVWAQAPLWAQAMQRFVQGPVKEVIGLAYRQLFGEGYKFDARPAVVEHLATVHNRMVRTPDEAYDLVASQVARGAAAGESIEKIAARVDEVLTATGTEHWQGRAVAVARTETLGALSAGRSDAFEAIAEELDEEFEHMWLSTLDLKTRRAHVLADGQRVPLGQPYIVGEEPLMRPHDPLGSASNVINCRCDELILSPGEEVDMSNRQFADPDEAAADQPVTGRHDQKTHGRPKKTSKTKAQDRQAAIDTARASARVAAELDEQAANIGGVIDKDANRMLAHRIGAAVAKGAIPADVADRMRQAVADGDMDAALTAAWAHAETLGVDRIARAGDVVTFDRKAHKAIDGDFDTGDPVQVVRPGSRWQSGDEDVLLEKAVVEDAPQVAAWHTHLRGDLGAVADLVGAPETAPARPLGGGMVGDVALLTYRGGKLVRKELGAKARGQREGKDGGLTVMADAEQLAPLVMQAVGARAPAVLRTGKHSLHMAHVDGKVGADIVPWGGDTPRDLVDSDQGRLLGLADALMVNLDRNDGNWILGDNGELWGIDHGSAFESDRYIEYLSGNAWASHFLAGRNLADRNDMSPADMAVIRARLEALRPDFEHLGRLAWWRAMMKRMNKLHAAAAGTGTRLGGGP
jgi:Phage Mu protein F like protein